MHSVWEDYSQIREQGGIVYSPSHRCHFAAGADDVDSLLRSENMTVEYPFRASRQVFGKTMLDSDDPSSMLVKKNISTFFSNRAVSCYEKNFITPIVRNLLKKTFSGENAAVGFDNNIAQRIPTLVILAVLGIDLAYDEFIFSHLDVLVRYIDSPGNSLEEASESRFQLLQLLRKCINGETSIDTSGMISNMDRTIYADEEELLDTLLMVLAAGMATTISAFNSLIVEIYNNKSYLKEHASEPIEMRNFVNTMLFEKPPLHTTVRFVKVPFSYKGFDFKRSSMIKIFLASANAEQQCPYRNQEHGTEKKLSYTFGKGKHACLGVNLAICEMLVFAKEFLPYIDLFRLDYGDEIAYKGETIKSIKDIKLIRI